MIFQKKPYSLNKSKHSLHSQFALFKKYKKQLTEQQQLQFENDLRDLEEAILAKDREKASALAEKVEKFSKEKIKKSKTFAALEIVLALIFAFLIATVVRQSWFELYEIPSGSMRPSFREKDRLTVSKTAFGINVPVNTSHFYFDENLVKRGGVIIFSTDNLPISDTDSTYFGFIPYKKRFIKRLIGKPGDTLYFYGGDIYGLDKNGDPLNVLIDDPWMKKLHHIPFLTFHGVPSKLHDGSILFQQFGQPVGRITPTTSGKARGEIYVNNNWVKETPFEGDSTTINGYSDFWGIGNYAIAALLTKEEVEKDPDLDTTGLADGVMYLKILHHPNLSKHEGAFTPFYSVLPLEQKHLDALRNNLYTPRIVVEGGKAIGYGEGSPRRSKHARSLPGIPDGTYEFFNGKGETVSSTGWTSPLPTDHPLNDKSNLLTQKLFNFQNRYLYFKDGDLHAMGAPIVLKNDPALIAFVESEKSKETAATKDNPYLAYVDKGSPVNDGVWDKEKIKTFGLTIPEKQYLVLGDNHANSSDSRIFGFVPEDNLQGVPSVILWPPGERWGSPPQTPYEWLVAPRVIVWLFIGLLLTIWFVIHRLRLNRRLFNP